jgi:hypothetical protein
VFGFKNFAGSYEFPVEALAGLLSIIGLSWNVMEKLLYFAPFALLSIIAPWLFAREILGSNRWAFLSALLYASNTYLLLFSAGGQFFIMMADALAPLVLLAFIRTVRWISPRWAVIGGLLLGLQAAYEIRVAYLTILIGFLYVLIALVVQADFRVLIKLGGLSVLAVAAFLGTQLYWLLPLSMYGSSRSLPVGTSPWIAFMQLGHGFTGVSPFWTGSTPTSFRTAPLNPMYFIFPLLAFAVLLRRRISQEITWLIAASLIIAFLIKQTNPPGGEIYAWMFYHVPGWNLFREASKLYFVIALAYAVLIPATCSWLFQSRPSPHVTRTIGAVVALVAVGAVVIVNFVPFEGGQLRYTTQPRPMPGSFLQVEQILNNDHIYGPVLWLGGASVRDPDNVIDHKFGVRSRRHPLVELSGTLQLEDTGAPIPGDVLAQYCRAPDLPFCYVNADLFPYLIGRIGARYVVAPAGPQEGSLPPGVTHRFLIDKVAAALGAPALLGRGPEALALWRTDVQPGPIESSRAVAVVDGTPALTQDVLPALQALELPVVYTVNPGLGITTSPPPESIDVIPASNQVCAGRRGEFAILSRTTLSTISVRRGSATVRLPVVKRPEAAPGWGVFGPVGLVGTERIAGSLDGPCISWSPLAAEELSQRVPVHYVVPKTFEDERVRFATGADDWLEFRRGWDSGWNMSQPARHAPGDGLFNLYLLDHKASGMQTELTFVTLGWEHVGIAVSLLWTSVMIIVSIALRRSPRAPLQRVLGGSGIGWIDDSVRLTAVAGLSLTVFAAVFGVLAWWGIPSLLPEIDRWLGPSGSSDPYRLAETDTILAMAALTLSLFLRLIGSGWRSLAQRRVNS